jgi:hypothetical protein
MKPDVSPLRILDVAVLKFEYETIFPDKDFDIRATFDKYDLDIDFTLTNDNFIRVFLKTDINKGSKKLPGYTISVEIVCVFEFDKAIKITEEEKRSMEGFSTIYIALNHLRSFISQFTGNTPMGKYILPSIDLNKLIEQKKNLLIKKMEKAKKRLPKTKKEVKES